MFCLECDQLYENKCLHCESDYYLEVISDNVSLCTQCNDTNSHIINNSVCITCSPYCQKCLNINQCEQCLAGFFLNKENGKCSKTCNQSYYSNISDYTCERCDLQCLSCSGPGPNECLSCQNSLFLLNSSCLTNCPPNTYAKNDTQTCECKFKFKNCVNNFFRLP